MKKLDFPRIRLKLMTIVLFDFQLRVKMNEDL